MGITMVYPNSSLYHAIYCLEPSLLVLHKMFNFFTTEYTAIVFAQALCLTIFNLSPRRA